MAVKFTSVKCPECGANLPIEEGRTQVFCSYCGTKVIVTNENEYIYRHIDEAEIKQAETDRIVELKRLEMVEKRLAHRQKVKKLKIIITIILGIIALISYSSGPSMVGVISLFIILYMWLLFDKKDDDDDDFDIDGKVRVPAGIDEYEKKSYKAIETMFRGAGFTNVSCIPLDDLTTGILKRPDMVESITINGNKVTSGGKKFSPHATVVVSYHSYARR